MQDTRFWIPNRLNAEKSKVRLFCFPWAGGGASFYLTYFKSINPDIEVCPIQLPGRENLYSLPFYNDMDSLCHDLLRDLKKFMSEKSYAFFGHSMGGIISYMLVKQMLKDGFNIPEHVLISASAPPDQLSIDPDGDIEDLLITNETDQEIMENNELLDIYLPILKADLALLKSITEVKPGIVDSIPFTIMGGKSDKLLPYQSLESWKKRVNSLNDITLYDGGHMYIKNNQSHVIHDIETILTPTINPRGGHSPVYSI
ncbi:surfactin synthase thioesterase subunit [Bacillus pakistanensis]|uniref:Surfactin synthase thioesterase subunit n=1 Tax=Rossellomorea pakistanensis TaxID=992288 RepID=A0ABS2NE82_9BACI|nr:thioesterase [Bacillus pakistanensis]MBM7586120.1 surfactin synthase thioesterase subunit [Bacillus pakistanensis]